MDRWRHTLVPSWTGRWLVILIDGMMDGWKDGYSSMGRNHREGLIPTELLKQAAKPRNPVLLLKLLIKNTEWHNCKK